MDKAISSLISSPVVGTLAGVTSSFSGGSATAARETITLKPVRSSGSSFLFVGLASALVSVLTSSL